LWQAKTSNMAEITTMEQNQRPQFEKFGDNEAELSVNASTSTTTPSEEAMKSPRSLHGWKVSSIFRSSRPI
jgi:hypothetical protein